jgi:hypothetical protein
MGTTKKLQRYRVTATGEQRMAGLAYVHATNMFDAVAQSARLNNKDFEWYPEGDVVHVETSTLVEGEVA